MGVKLGNGKWAIKEDKLLAYNDNSGRFFNKEFDFSRGSSATYVAKDGLIKTAGLQATNLVNNGDFSELGSELVTNGNFDTDSDWTKGTGWVIQNGYAESTSLNTRSLYQNIGTPVVGKIYKVTYTILETNGGNFKFVYGGVNGTIRNSVGTYTEYIIATSSGDSNIYFDALNVMIGSIDNVSVKQVDPNDYWTLDSGWSFGDNKATCDGSGYSNISQPISNLNNKKIKVQFDIVDYTSGTIRILPNDRQDGADVRFSGNGTYTQIYTSTANKIDFQPQLLVGSITNISIQEIQTDTPRIDFSDSVKGALLLEPQSTNLVTYSEDFSQWSTLNGSSVDLNFAISPDGTQNASKFNFNGTTNGRVELQITGLTPAQPVTFSVWLKTLSGTEQVYIGHSSFGLKEVTVTDQWQRYTSSTISGASGGAFPRVRMDSASSVLVWGYQVEEQSFSTSYIPNHGVSGGVTRLADVCNNSGSAQDFSESGVLYAEISALANDLTERRITISDGTTSNRVAIEYTLSSNQIKGRVVSSSSTSANMNFTASSIVDFSKIAISYKQNEFNLWINATKVATDTSGNAPIGLNKISFDNGTGSNAFHGNVRELQVFTEALTDEQLQKLTTI